MDLKRFNATEIISNCLPTGARFAFCWAVFAVILLATTANAQSRPGITINIPIGGSAKPTITPQPTPIQTIKATVYDRHFVKNTFTPDRNGAFIVIHDMREFDRYFGTATVMNDRRNMVTDKTFDTQIVLAVIRDGLWEFQPEMVIPTKDGIMFRYSARESKAKFHAVTPLIVTVPKNVVDSHSTVFFVENGREVAKEKAVWHREPPQISGGWSEYKPITRETRELFEKIMDSQSPRDRGRGHYTPLMFSVQPVAGKNYRFICSVRPGSDVAVVSAYVDLRQNVKRVKITHTDLD